MRKVLMSYINIYEFCKQIEQYKICQTAGWFIIYPISK